MPDPSAVREALGLMALTDGRPLQVSEIPSRREIDEAAAVIAAAALAWVEGEEVRWCTKHRSTAVPVLLSMCEVADERFGSFVAAEDNCQFVPARVCIETTPFDKGY